MSYLIQPTQDQSLNGIISITDGSNLVIENGSISGLSNLNIGDNITCKTLTTENIYGQNGNLSIGNNSSNVTINGSNITLTGPTVYLQSQTIQTIDNNIELNLNGGNAQAVNSGITVLGNLNIPVARFQTDANLDFVITSANNKLSVQNIASNSGIISTIASNNGSITALSSQNGNITSLTSNAATIDTLNSTNLAVSNNANISLLQVTNTTDSTNFTNGSLECKGGAGISKNLNVGGDINGAGNLYIAQNANINQSLVVNQNLIVNQDANIQGTLNITGNTVTNNTSTSTNIIGTNGTIANLTSSKVYSTNQTSYTSSISHVNANSIQVKDYKGYNTRTTTLTADTSTSKNFNGTNATINNVSIPQFGTFSLLPAGTIQMTVTNNALPPTGWLYCRGQAVDRIVYATLYTAIGDTFGPGNGTTTFNIPNFQGCFLRGMTVTDSAISGYTTLAIGAYRFDTTRSHTHQFGVNYATDGYASGTRSNQKSTQSGGTDITTTSLTDDRGFGPGTETAPYHSIVNYLIKI